jgi:hypothetical protein
MPLHPAAARSAGGAKKKRLRATVPCSNATVHCNCTLLLYPVTVPCYCAQLQCHRPHCTQLYTAHCNGTVPCTLLLRDLLGGSEAQRPGTLGGYNATVPCPLLLCPVTVPSCNVTVPCICTLPMHPSAHVTIPCYCTQLQCHCPLHTLDATHRTEHGTRRTALVQGTRHTSHPSSVIRHLSSVICHLSSVICHLSQPSVPSTAPPAPAPPPASIWWTRLRRAGPAPSSITGSSPPLLLLLPHILDIDEPSTRL